MEAILKSLWYSLAIWDIINFLNDDSGNIISDEGMRVLSDDDLYEEVMKNHNELKKQ